MSKIDQAFVKAFARRQIADVNQAQASVVIPPSTDRSPSAMSRLHATGNASIRIDASVAESADVWIDETTGQWAHADSPHSPVPKPRFNESGGKLAPESFASEYAIASFTTDLGIDGEEVREHLADSLEAIADAEPVTIDATSRPLASQPAPPDPPATPGPSLLEPSFRMGQMPQKSVETRVAAQTRVAAAPPASIKTPVAATSATTAPQAPVELPPADDERSSATETTEPPIDHVGDVAQPPVPLRPAWEVDAFELPAAVTELFFEEDTYRQVGDRIAEAVAGGLRSAMVTSDKPAEGRSTVALGIALAAAAAGVNVLLIDADFQSRSLADALRLDIEKGWDEAITTDLPLDEIALVSTEDGITLLPLRDAHDETLATPDLESLLTRVTPSFDFVIVDGGVGLDSVPKETTIIDSAFIVRDADRTSPAEVQWLTDRLNRSGIQGVGVIENFV